MGLLKVLADEDLGHVALTLVTFSYLTSKTENCLKNGGEETKILSLMLLYFIF